MKAQKAPVKSASQKPAQKAGQKPTKAASAKLPKLSAIKNALFGGAKKAGPAKATVTKKPAAAAAPKAAPVAKKAGKGIKAAVKAAKPAAGSKKAPPPPAQPAVAKPLRIPSPESKRAAKAASAAAHAAATNRQFNEHGESVCREVACEGLATTGGYCRMHYIKNWKKIKRKELILKEGKLNQYIEELVAKYPDKYIEAIRQDLASDKDFAKVIYDLDLDESVDDFEMEGEGADNLIDTIKRDFEDEGESF